MLPGRTPTRSPQAAALLLMSALGAACGSAESVWPAPGAESVVVYYPVDGDGGAAGRIAVRVENAALPEAATELLLTTFPSDTRESYEIDRSEAYTNLVLTASTAAILEISAQSASKRGDALFVQVPVPPGMLPCVRCLSTDCSEASCQSDPSATNCGQLHCQGWGGVNFAACSTDADCVRWSGQTLSIGAEGLGLTWLGSDPAVAQLSVPTEPGQLLWAQNQHLTALGESLPAAEAPQLKISSSTITSISLPSGRAGDRILLRLYAGDGSFSPLAEQVLGQAEIEGVSVIGAEKYSQYTVFFVSPYGSDQRGYCPSTDTSPPLCYGGGLSSAQIETASGARPSSIAVNGDVREGPAHVVVLVDVGATAQRLDPNLRRLGYAQEVLRHGLRSFDRLSLVVFGPGGATIEADFSGRGIDRDPAGEGSLSGALDTALSLQEAGESLKIVALVASNGGSSSYALRQALKTVPVQMIDIGAGAYDGEGLDLQELAALGGGTLWPSMPYTEARLQTALGRVRNILIGSFLVRFEDRLPANTPLSVTIAGSVFTGSFGGAADD